MLAAVPIVVMNRKPTARGLQVRDGRWPRAACGVGRHYCWRSRSATSCKDVRCRCCSNRPITALYAAKLDQRDPGRALRRRGQVLAYGHLLHAQHRHCIDGDDGGNLHGAPARLAAFPTVLLLTTLDAFVPERGLDPRWLLEGHTGAGAAGAVIGAFGHFLIGGNFAVGLIVFAILVVINFVVVTKVPNASRGFCAVHPGCDAG